MAERSFIVDVPTGIPTPALDDLISRVAPQLVIAAWRELAADQSDSGVYLALLTLQEALRYPYNGDPHAAAVVNLAYYADWIEHGRAGFHLPSRMTKWKQGENGPYARVAFRIFGPATDDSTPSARRGAMPAALVARVRQLQHGQRLTGFGETYKQSKSYTFWQSYEAFQFPPELAALITDDHAGYTWKSSQFEGLFQSGMRNTPQGGTQSEYTTIRTIKPDSPGWYIPQTAPHNYTDRALEQAAPAIQDLVDRARAQDIEAALVAAGGGLL